jgi:hypothetical protein
MEMEMEMEMEMWNQVIAAWQRHLSGKTRIFFCALTYTLTHALKNCPVFPGNFCDWRKR